MSDFNGSDVYDRWNKLNIKDCILDVGKKSFIKKIWKGQKIYYPNNYEKILVNRYGKKWYVKKDKKIPQTMNEL